MDAPARQPAAGNDEDALPPVAVAIAAATQATPARPNVAAPAVAQPTGIARPVAAAVRPLPTIRRPQTAAMAPTQPQVDLTELGADVALIKRVVRSCVHCVFVAQCAIAQIWF